MDLLARRVLARDLDCLASRDPGGYGTARGWEHRKERDEAVEKNVEMLSPHLRALWRKTKNLFKGTPDRRYEMFLQYVHENPEQGLELLQDEVEQQLRKWEKSEEKERAEAEEWERLRRHQPKPQPGYDSAVPF